MSNGGGRIISVNSASFTIGQPFVGSITNGNNSIRQGFQQPSFRLSVPGCMDTLACNYDTLATINDSSCVYPPNGTSVVTACDSYSWDGFNYTASGVFTNSYPNASGCDSIHTLNLTINYSNTSITNASNCDTYIWNGQTYSGSGIYTYITTNANGCDSIAILNLTIILSTNSTSNITACDTYSWNGNTYTSSGVYTFVTINSNNCDSTATLNLTINPSTTSISNVTECDTYTWNGITYSTSGIYTFISTNAVGCTHIDSLVLTINNFTTSSSTITECDSYSWNGATYVSSGSYTYLTTNANGCDSTATLNLTVNPSTTSSSNVTACDTFSWNGTTYDSSGTYVYTPVNLENDYSIKFEESNNNDYIDCGNNLIQGNSFSFMSWIKINSVTGDVSNVFRQHMNNGHWLRFLPNSTQLNFKLSQFEIASTTNLNVDQWYHIATTFDGANMKIYINGVLDKDEIAIGSFTNYQEPFIIGGCVPCSNGEFFDGNLDNTSVWSKSLSQLEISDYMNCPPSGSESSVEGSWNFEQVSGATVFDQTSNGNDGTIYGAILDVDVPSQSCPLTNANGCDSTAILNLTINQSTTSTTNVTACDSVTWNGVTYDSSGTYSYSGSASNNYSMSFDGVDDYINITNPVGYNTFLGWIKVGPNANSGDAIISSNGNAFIRIIGQSPSYVLGFNSPSGANPNGQITFQESVWTFVSVVNSNGSMTFYVNGVQDATFSESPFVSEFIGSKGNFGHFIDAEFDDFSLWNTALSQQEIQNYMNCPPTGNELDLLAYWNFEEGQDTTAYDQTTNGNNGTLVNGPTWSNNTPTQSCVLTNANGCDSTATLNLTIDICGCTDSTALNYNPNATSNDGSCIAFVYGCMDSTQFNYNVLANTDDGSCMAIAYGCTDSLALNFDPLANTDDGFCCGASLPIPFGTQIGMDIDGEAAGDRSGYSVSLIKSDGNTVAIGAHSNDGNGTDAGHVRIYENIW